MVYYHTADIFNDCIFSAFNKNVLYELFRVSGRRTGSGRFYLGELSALSDRRLLLARIGTVCSAELFILYLLRFDGLPCCVYDCQNAGQDDKCADRDRGPSFMCIHYCKNVWMDVCAV